MLETVKFSLKKHLPDDLTSALMDSYHDVRINALIHKYEAAELAAGKFVEACIRVLQYELNSKVYTPIGVEIKNIIHNLKNFENVPVSSSTESFRIHIPRVLVSIYNIRNKRGVGHLGGDINPNQIDANLVPASTSWVLCELFSAYYVCTLLEAQEIVSQISKRPLELVEQLGKVKRVLLTSLSLKEKTLLLLAGEYPNPVKVDLLINQLEPKDKSKYKTRVLKELHDKRLIEYDNLENSGIISSLGLADIESKYENWLKRINSKGEI